MKYVVSILLAMVLLVVPGLAFVPTATDIPVAQIEKQTATMTADWGTYSYQRVAVDAGVGVLNNQTPVLPGYTPQSVYSGMIFGADGGKGWEVFTINNTTVYAQPKSWTAGVIANRMNTSAEGVVSDTTRQFISQGGTTYLTAVPRGSDAEVVVPWTVDMGFTKTNLAWMSSEMSKFTATPQSYAAVGGNHLDAIPIALSPNCQNAWLIERETQQPISIEAVGNTSLLEAYAGTMSNADVKFYPASDGDSAKAKMSGYAERFGGYTNADVSVINDPFSTTGNNQDNWDDNKIVIDFGQDKSLVEDFLTAGRGIVYDIPVAADFPEMDETNPLWGMITWPNQENPDSHIYNP